MQAAAGLQALGGGGARGRVHVPAVRQLQQQAVARQPYVHLAQLRSCNQG